jgi:hypothetical protein
MERLELAPASALFGSLGDPARLMIVPRLVDGAARVSDLVAMLGLMVAPQRNCRWRFQRLRGLRLL